MKSLFRLLVVAATCSLVVRAQQVGCTLDSLDDDTIAELLGSSLVANAGQAPTPTITILDTNLVCRATAPVFGLYRYVSVVVSYNCDGSPPCPSGELESLVT